MTTLHDYSPVNLENAYIYSDNIYFAKAALKIGYDDFMAGLDRLGFNQDLPSRSPYPSPSIPTRNGSRRKYSWRTADTVRDRC